MGQQPQHSQQATTGDQSAVIAALGYFSRATAVKRGRRSEWPYVPVIDHGTHTEQLRGRAYATRAEAVEFAHKSILARREALQRKLRDPRYRALREMYGLPREIGAAP